MVEMMKDLISKILNCKCLTPEELNQLIDSAKKTGYRQGYDQCKIDYGLDNPQPRTKQNDEANFKGIDCVILFVKANRGKLVLSEINGSMRLSSQIAEPLYDATQMIWVGQKDSLMRNNNIKKIFEFKGECSEIGPEYDSIAVQINLANRMSADLSDSFNRHEFIRDICNSENQCTNISNRLPQHILSGLSLIAM